MSRRERIDPVPADYSEKRVSPIVDKLARYVATRAETLLSIADKEKNQLKAMLAFRKVARNLLISISPSEVEDLVDQYENFQDFEFCSYFAASINGQFSYVYIVLSGSKAAGRSGTKIEGKVGPAIVSHHAMLRAIQAFKPKTHSELITLMKVILLVAMQTNRDGKEGGHKSIEFDGHLLHFKRRSDEDMLVLATIIEETRRDLR